MTSLLGPERHEEESGGCCFFSLSPTLVHTTYRSVQSPARRHSFDFHCSSFSFYRSHFCEMDKDRNNNWKRQLDTNQDAHAHFVLSIILITFLVATTKSLQKQLKEAQIYFDSQFKSIMVGKAWQQELEVACHITSIVMAREHAGGGSMVWVGQHQYINYCPHLSWDIIFLCLCGCFSYILKFSCFSVSESKTVVLKLLKGMCLGLWDGIFNSDALYLICLCQPFAWLWVIWWSKRTAGRGYNYLWT